VSSTTTLQGHRHLPGRAINPDMTEKLHAGGWRQVGPVGASGLDEPHFRPEGVVELVRPKRSRMQRPGDEFPERLKILKLRFIGIVVVRGRVMHVGCQPHSVGDA
jgi:hypothetical protein